jgi:hypothetical protein
MTILTCAAKVSDEIIILEPLTSEAMHACVNGFPAYSQNIFLRITWKSRTNKVLTYCIEYVACMWIVYGKHHTAGHTQLTVNFTEYSLWKSDGQYCFKKFSAFCRTQNFGNHISVRWTQCCTYLYHTMQNVFLTAKTVGCWRTTLFGSLTGSVTYSLKDSTLWLILKLQICEKIWYQYFVWISPSQ